ncbi:hypothetical protein EFK50_07750 [Nocardioides marmoriginsengisoli]|uniref:Uncharacterized protein n=1 Tax=Nocardioides marmoriginsengisoli TaxID=661483 RepID=A0A3N0CJJ0_9ACTN|nr:hypothetical protein EFK50_07750 [Nocardioides marmoriginsengisoli]
MSETEPTRCVHCDARIVQINYALGPQWVHQSSEAAFHDNVSWFCQITVATPNPAPTVLPERREVGA